MDEFNTPESLLIIAGLGGASQGIVLQLANVELFEAFRLVLAFVTVICFVGAFAVNRMDAPNTTAEVFGNSSLLLHSVLTLLLVINFGVTQNPRDGFGALILLGLTVYQFIYADKKLRNLPAKQK